MVSLLAEIYHLINLSESWRALESWWIIGLLIVLSLVEFLVDKIPAVNHINDIIQTFVRPTAGAILFAVALKRYRGEPDSLDCDRSAGVRGRAAKSVLVRPITTATTAGAGDVPVSVLEDVAATTISVLSVVIPILVAIILVVFLIGLIWWIANQSIEKTT